MIWLHDVGFSRSTRTAWGVTLLIAVILLLRPAAQSPTLIQQTREGKLLKDISDSLDGTFDNPTLDFQRAAALSELMRRVPAGEMVKATVVIDRKTSRVIGAVRGSIKNDSTLSEFSKGRYDTEEGWINGTQTREMRQQQNTERQARELSGGVSINAPEQTLSSVGRPVDPSELKVMRSRLGRYDVLQNTESPNVGGVLLNKAATALFELSDITNVGYDKERGQLVLYGERSYTSPPLALDDLIVAARSAYVLQEDPAIDIGSRESNERGFVRVTYWGGTENTHFGEVMFQADLLLKHLMLGSGSDAEMASAIPGYQPSTVGKDEAAGTFRAWFVPGEVLLSEASDGGGFEFATAQVMVRTSMDSRSAARAPTSKRRFAEHLTAHYDEYAQRFPVLLELRNLLKVVAVVKWLKAAGAPLDQSALFRQRPALVQTPAYTAAEGIVVRSEFGVSSAIGGVTFCRENPESPGCQVFARRSGQFRYAPMLALTPPRTDNAESRPRYVPTYGGGRFAVALPIPPVRSTLRALASAAEPSGARLVSLLLSALCWILVSGNLLRRLVKVKE